MSEARTPMLPERVEPVNCPLPASRYAFGAFSIDLHARKLCRGGNVVPLPARAFDTLAYLIAHANHSIDKNEIIAAAWRDVAVTDDSLIHAVSVLRRALSDDTSHPSMIETIPRFGYRFIGSVRPIGDSGSTISEPTNHTKDRRIFFSWRPGFAIGAALSGLAVLALWFVTDKVRGPGESEAQGAVVLHQIAPSGTSLLSGGVVSPTGSHLAFLARDEASGETALWVRTLRSSQVEKLPGTTGASKPFWSPDGRSIGFFAQSNLVAVGLAGEAPHTIATIGSMPAGGTWGTRNVILFADWTRGLSAVSAEGGAVTAVTKVDHGTADFAHSWPQFLPDGRHFLYQVVSMDASRAGVYLGALDSPRSTRLLDFLSPALYVPPGFLLYVQHDLLMAEGFDISRLTLDGRPVVLARGVLVPSWQDGDIISGSRDVLAFREGDVRQRLRLVDRSGAERDLFDLPLSLTNFRVSPSQGQLLATGAANDSPAMWVVDLARHQHTRLESEGLGPIWASDSNRIGFTARGGLDLYVRSASDISSRPLVSDQFVKVPNDWSPDGKEIVYAQRDPETKLDLWIVSLSGGAPRPLLKTRFNETQARISPDGRWIAYQSDESGTPEVYVRSFPQLGKPSEVSFGGAAQPQWRRDQSELFYLSSDNAVMAVPVSAKGEVSFGAPQRLFQTPMTGSPSDTRDSYAAMADGQSFLLAGPPDPSQAARISVMVNWTMGLASMAPRGPSGRHLDTVIRTTAIR